MRKKPKPRTPPSTAKKTIVPVIRKMIDVVATDDPSTCAKIVVTSAGGGTVGSTMGRMVAVGVGVGVALGLGVGVTVGISVEVGGRGVSTGTMPASASFAC